MAKNSSTCGVVSEFNPFHRGHEFLLKEIRRKGYSHIVAVMSGNYVQRGEPAIFSKWARTKMALQCGVDLVIELPLPWSLSGAERFAFGGVSCLHSLNCVDALAFGSECGEIESLMKLALLLNSDEFKNEVQKQLKNGSSFAVARKMAVAELVGENSAALMDSPNNILGIEYCKALIKLSSQIRPFTIKRIGAGHHEESVPRFRFPLLETENRAISDRIICVRCLQSDSRDS